MIGRARLAIRFGSRTAAAGITAAAATAAAPPAPLPRPIFPVGPVVTRFRPRGPRPLGQVVIGVVTAADIVGQPAFGGRQIPRVALIRECLPAGAVGFLVARPGRPTAVVASGERLVIAAAGPLVATARRFGAVSPAAAASAAPPAPAATGTILVARSLASVARRGSFPGRVPATGLVSFAGFVSFAGLVP